MCVCVCFWLIYAAWPHRRLNVASLEATLWSRTRSIGQWHIIYVCLSSCLRSLFTHTQSQTHKQTDSAGWRGNKYDDQPVKSFAAKKFCLSAFKLRPDPKPDSHWSKKTTKTTHIALFPPLSLSPLCPSTLSPSGDFCRLAKVSWLINVPAAVWLFHVRHAHYLPPISIELKQLPRPPTPLSTI